MAEGTGASALRTALVVLRRATVALAVASVISGFVKLQAHEPTPARHGGWRELSLSELSQP